MSSNPIPQLSISAIQFSFKAPKPVTSYFRKKKKTKPKATNKQAAK